VVKISNNGSSTRDTGSGVSYPFFAVWMA
jgi:hypothetical protein